MNSRTSVWTNRALEAAVSLSTLVLAVIMPQIFHYFGLGKEFLPMFFPIVVLSFLAVRSWTGLVPAVLAPVLSCSIFGMPALPVAATVSLELVFLFLAVRFAVNKKWNLIAVLPVILVAGRAFSFCGNLAVNGGQTGAAWTFVSAAYPGLISLFVVGTLLYLFNKRKSVNEK